MSVSIAEVLEAGGYDIYHEEEDIRWLVNNRDELEEIMDYAEDMADKLGDYYEFCANHGADDLPRFEEWLVQEGE